MCVWGGVYVNIGLTLIIWLKITKMDTEFGSKEFDSYVGNTTYIEAVG